MLFLYVLIIRHERQKFGEIGDGAGIVAFCDEKLCTIVVSEPLGLRRQCNRPGEISDCMIDLTFPAIGLASPEESILHRRVDRKRRIQVAYRLLELAGFDIDPSSPNIG